MAPRTRPAAAIALAMLLALGACGGSGADSDGAAEQVAQPYPPATYIDDNALFDDALQAELGERLAALHAATGHELRVATMLTLDGRPVDEVAQAYIAERGIGHSGALLLIATADEELGLVPAPGAEPWLDPAFRTETEALITTHFDDNDMPGGIRAALGAVEARLAPAE
jgi:uncharacterized membrane protein YgcG